MFWKFATTSNIDSILEKEDVTLNDLLEDDDVLQECKGQNTKLVEFLCRPNVIEELVTLIITEPANEVDEAIKYKHANIACELLTSDVPQINDILGDTESLREKLFSFLDNEQTLNPLLASFFSKVIGILLSRKPEPTLEHIKNKNDFLGSVLKHLGTSAIMDLLLRLVTCVEAADLRAQVLSWLNENKLVERLIGHIDPSVNDDFHCNSAQSLCDIIRLSREHMYTMQESAQEDPLLNTLERKETVQLLLQHMFDKEIKESVIINGISVLLALLEIRRPAPFGFPEMAPELTQLDVERLACGVSKTLHGLSDRLADFHKLLEHPPQREIMHCTFGELDPPLGNTRLHVGKLLSAILITNTHNINVQLSELQIFNALLDLFFRYEYNNFLHTQVVQCIQTVLGNAVTVSTTRAPVYSNDNEQNSVNSPEEQRKEEDEAENPRKVAPLLTHLFEDCRLIQRILDAWEDNRVHETEASGHRKGNMGHLTIITNQIIENMEKGTNAERIREFIEGMPEEDQGRWQKFVAEPLAEMNGKNSRELGGHNPMHFSSDDDGETDYRDIPFSSNSVQQAFTDFQLQQITSNFIDQFGFTDGDFAEHDDTDNKFNKINSIDFDIKADTNTPSQELFEGVCRARLPNFGDSSDEEDNKDLFDTGEEGDDDWDLTNNAIIDSPFKYGSTTPTITVRPRSSSGNSSGSSSSEDNDTAKSLLVKLPDGDEEMDTHPQDIEWRASFDDSETSSSEGSNNSTPNTSPRTGAATNTAFETALWTSEPDETPPDAEQDNWANFDSLENLASEQSEEKVNEAAASPVTDRAFAYATPDSTSETKDQNKQESTEAKSQARCESMEIVMETVASQQSTRPSFHDKPAGAPPSDNVVMMEVQEGLVDSVPSASQDQSPSKDPSAAPSLYEEPRLSENVAMETDDVSASILDSSSRSQVAERSSESPDEQTIVAQSLSEGISSTTEQDPCSDIVTCPADSSNLSSDATESDSDQLNSSESDSIVAHVSPGEEGNAVPVESEACPDTTTAESSTANGDNAAIVTKSDGDLQNNEVTSSTVATQHQMNGPV